MKRLAFHVEPSTAQVWIEAREPQDTPLWQDGDESACVTPTSIAVRARPDHGGGIDIVVTTEGDHLSGDLVEAFSATLQVQRRLVIVGDTLIGDIVEFDVPSSEVKVSGYVDNLTLPSRLLLLLK